MIDIKILLPELRKLVHELSEDLLTRVSNDSALDAGLQEAYKQIEKGGRTSDPYEVWLEDYLDQVAVAWVLSCVFVRFMEDNNLIEECWLSGEGDRRKRAEETHEIYFRQHPRNSDRDYFEHVFREIGKIPACFDLFAEGKTPLWAVGPSGDAAMKLRAFWREIDSDSGQLKRTFDVEAGDTRFLGDLYQDLSERARKKYALLQTPVFVEEFILDRTLNPAIEEFGLKEVRMIDPTCGSGHFLLGGFARLFRLWSKPENTTGNAEKDAQKALDGVWGCDINPFAIAIARFRLIVAALRACDLDRLDDAPGWGIHLATGDSLLFGKRWDAAGQTKSEQQFFETVDEGSWAPEIYACEDKDAISIILGQQYHTVVGNPPYIIVRDKSLNQAYRDRYSTCYRSYSLGVPFTERFFDLCVNAGNEKAGFVGMITANSFMKREFGKRLIEEFFSKIDLTHVVDSSGAYIPGHGTPTVILFGRNRRPIDDKVRAVFGIKGEATTPIDPSRGEVWQSIVNHIDLLDGEDAYTSSADVSRSTFSSHPWSVGGGGASDLKEVVESKCKRKLKDIVCEIGFGAVTREDDVYLISREVARRHAIPECYIRSLVSGDELRDWAPPNEAGALFPYDPVSLKSQAVPEIEKFLWPWKTQLSVRVAYGISQIGRGLRWSEYSMLFANRFRTPLYLAFPSVVSHNHFFLDRGKNLYKDTAPLITLPTNSSEVDYIALLGFLNSSASCFWMKQVSHQKQMVGGDGVRISSRAKVPYQFAGTRLREMPIPDSFMDGPFRDRLVGLASRIDQLSTEAAMLSPKHAIDFGMEDGGASKVRKLLAEFESRRSHLRSEMVFLQEEIDFTTYVMFGLCDDSLLAESSSSPSVVIDAGMRPFEILQQRNVDGFAVPSDIPPEWPECLKGLWKRRIEAIQASKDLSLIEDDHYKRRWLGKQGLFNHTAKQDEAKSSCKAWLLDRLETEFFWPDADQHEPRLQSVSKLADKASGDGDFMQVAAIYRGRDDFDLSSLIAELVEAESVPLLPVLFLKSSGLRKREVWKKTWELQRKVDMDLESSGIKLPPSYVASDFARGDYSRLRGKLDVPKERWISFPHFETEGDPSLVVGWAGWNHLQQGTAVVAYYDARKNDGWSAEQLKPLLTSLDELLPWIHQWHPEVDAEYHETAGTSFQTLLDSEIQELGLTIEDIRNWTPPAKKVAGKSKPKQPRQSRKKKAEVEAEE